MKYRLEEALAAIEPLTPHEETVSGRSEEAILAARIGSRERLDRFAPILWQVGYGPRAVARIRALLAG